jgi:hypothetical protein
MYLSIQFYNNCRRLPQTKRHSSLFLHLSCSKFLAVMAAFTPSIHVFLGRLLFRLSCGIHTAERPIYMSYRTANLQTLHFKYLFNKYPY